MGKKSRMKKIRKEEQGPNAGKMMNDGKIVIQYFNPTKKLMQMKGYKDPQGVEALNTMMNRYSKYFKANNVNLEEGVKNEG